MPASNTKFEDGAEYIGLGENSVGARIRLSHGRNTIEAEVTAEDESTEQTYVIVVTREQPAPTPTPTPTPTPGNTGFVSVSGGTRSQLRDKNGWLSGMLGETTNLLKLRPRVIPSPLSVPDQAMPAP